MRASSEALRLGNTNAGGWLAPSASRRLTWRDRLLLLAVTLVVLLPGTFGVSLFDRDEGWYAQVAREMVESGDWLIPHYLGQPWLAKPPLLYWCVGAVWLVVGVHVWAARLVCVLAMTGAVQLMATLAAELLNRRAALLAGISFITAALPVVLGKVLLTDALLLWWCLAAMLCLWRFSTQGATLGRAALFWICVGLGILTKGPAILLFVGAFGLALRFQNPKSRWLTSTMFWLAFPVCVLIAAPWYVYAARHAGGTFVQQFLWFEIASRMVSAPHGHTGPPGYYVVISLVGWLPWMVLVPGAVMEAWRARRVDAVLRFLLAWLGLPWLLLELLPSKLPHYILPCYVPLALLLGRMWDVGLERTMTRSQRVVLDIWVGVMVCAGAGLMVLGSMSAWTWAVGVCAAVLLAGFLLVWSAVRRQALGVAWMRAATAAVVFHVLVGAWLLPGFEPYRLSSQIAKRANALGGSATEVLVCGYTEPSMFFYLSRPARVVSDSEIRLLANVSSPARLLIVRDAEFLAAGLQQMVDGTDACRIDGFNYVKFRPESVWIVYQPGPSTRTSVNTTAPAKT